MQTAIKLRMEGATLIGKQYLSEAFHPSLCRTVRVRRNDVRKYKEEKKKVNTSDDSIPDGGCAGSAGKSSSDGIDSVFSNVGWTGQAWDSNALCGCQVDYSTLIRNPDGKSALLEYIDVERMDRDIWYRMLVWDGMLNPTWDGVVLPDGVLSWRKLAECMKKDQFPTAPEVEKIAEMTEIAGTRCPLMRLPIPGRPGYVFTIQNPRYRKDSEYQKLEDHILADYGMFLLAMLKDSVRNGKLDRSRTIRETEGLEVTRVSFDNFFFHRTGDPDTTQGDVIIHADLKQDLQDVVTEYQNVQLRMEIEYNAVENKLLIDPKIYTTYYGSRSQGRLINQHLLPVLRSDSDCDKEAEEFLTQYFPEGLREEAVPFDAVLVAKRMGVSMHKSDLSGQGDRVYGLFYPECRQGLVVDDCGRSRCMDLPDNTILYDYRIENDLYRFGTAAF